MATTTTPEQLQLQLVGMSCAGCAKRIDKALRELPNVTQVEVNFATEMATVTGHDLTAKPLIHAVTKVGFGASEIESNNDLSDYDQAHEAYQTQQFRKFILAAVLSFPLLYTMFSHFSLTQAVPVPELLLSPWFQLLLATPVQFGVGWQFYRGAYLALRSGTSNMDVLVALGTSAAYGYSVYLGFFAGASEHGLYFETSAMLITLIVLGKWFEARAKGRSSAAIRELLKLQPNSALKQVANGEFEAVAIDSLEHGDTILIKPGAQIPTDAKVTQGNSSVNEAMLTGESMPVDKTAGSQLFAGTLNQSGALYAEVTARGQDTLLAQIIHTVRQAQSSKAPIQRLADRVAGVFVPCVIAIAIATFLFWWFYLAPSVLEAALKASIAVLVIACPCALGLATPTSIMAGSGRAAQLGVLFKHSRALEQAYQVDTIVFDKTGTVTRGAPTLTDLEIAPEAEANEVHALAYALESHSDHPLAQALVNGLADKPRAHLSLSEYKNHSGQGVSASYDQQQVRLGSANFIAEFAPVSESWHKQIKRLEHAGRTVVLLAKENEVLGLFALSDTLRDEAATTLTQLRESYRLILLSGDNQATVAAVATELGMTDYFAEVMPKQKASVIAELQQQGYQVAMVGDGINDAPALATADLGIAMGNGSGVALETADVALLRDDLNALPRVFNLSRKTNRNIKQNLFWAFAYNSLGIPVAASGLLAPWLAGAAMALSSISVVINALRLQRMKV